MREYKIYYFDDPNGGFQELPNGAVNSLNDISKPINAFSVRYQYYFVASIDPTARKEDLTHVYIRAKSKLIELKKV